MVSLQLTTIGRIYCWNSFFNTLLVFLPSVIWFHWVNVSIYDQLYERITGWWEILHINKCCTIHELTYTPFKCEGFVQTAKNMTASRVFISCMDHSGFGKWLKTLFWGKYGIIMMVFMFWQPLYNSKEFGSTINQQNRSFVNTGRDVFPWKVYGGRFVHKFRD